MAKEYSLEVDLTDLAYADAADPAGYIRDMRDQVLIEPLDRDGNSLGPPVQARAVEQQGSGGESRPGVCKLAFECERKPANLRIGIATRRKIVPIKKRPKTPPPVFETVYGGALNRWQLTIIADCFAPEQQRAFIDRCHVLADHLAATPPFNRVDAGREQRGFRIEACFVASGEKGLFNSKKQSERRVYGDFGLVQHFLTANRIARRRNDMVLVLANLPDSGGAGERQDENISWVTPVDQEEVGRLPTSWLDIALHEIGHAFELDDEYEDPWPDAPAAVHKNVFMTEDENRIPEPDAVPWADLFAGDPPFVYLQTKRDPPLPPGWPPGYNTQQEKDQHRGVIGLFQGARYESAKGWRSSISCRMREVRDPFCRQCERIIYDAIMANDG